MTQSMDAGDAAHRVDEPEAAVRPGGKGRIVTVRHGRPALDRDVVISAREYGRWWSDYDLSGLADGQTAPSDLVALASAATTVLSSDLPRAMETARHVTQGRRAVPADPLYVEAPLPPPPVPFLKLRPGQWGVVSRSFWFWGYAPRGVETHPAAWRRVAAIADRLAAHADQGDVMLCAHGYLNWMITRRMRTIGWRLADRRGGNNYWSWRVFERATA
ncbi:MAG: histidine phosphatase family protein [Pseudomonadota bacterium]